MSAEEEEMAEKSVVPVRARQPDCLLRISSALEMCSLEVEFGESLPTSLAKWKTRLQRSISDQYGFSMHEPALNKESQELNVL